MCVCEGGGGRGVSVGVGVGVPVSLSVSLSLTHSLTHSLPPSLSPSLFPSPSSSLYTHTLTHMYLHTHVHTYTHTHTHTHTHKHTQAREWTQRHWSPTVTTTTRAGRWPTWYTPAAAVPFFRTSLSNSVPILRLSSPGLPLGLHLCIVVGTRECAFFRMFSLTECVLWCACDQQVSPLCLHFAIVHTSYT